MTKLTPKVLSQVTQIAKSQNLKKEELAFMFEEFFRVADLGWPAVVADSTMDFIAQTNREWMRQKPLKDGGFTIYVMSLRLIETR